MAKSLKSHFAVKKCHPNSPYLKEYVLKGFICPFCNGGMNLMITEVKGENKKFDGHEINFSCCNCGKVIGLGFSGKGIKFEEVVDYALKDYDSWKCNLLHVSVN